MTENITENQKKIMEILRKAPDMTYQHIALELGISKTAVGKNISRLRQRGYIRGIRRRYHISPESSWEKPLFDKRGKSQMVRVKISLLKKLKARRKSVNQYLAEKLAEDEKGSKDVVL